MKQTARSSKTGKNITVWCNPPEIGFWVSTGAKKSPGISLVPEQKSTQHRYIKYFTITEQFIARWFVESYVQ